MLSTTGVVFAPQVQSIISFELHHVEKRLNLQTKEDFMLFCTLFVFYMFLKLLLVEEKLKASQILIVAVGSHLKETNIDY